MMRIKCGAWETMSSSLYHYDQQMAGDFEVSVHNTCIHPPPQEEGQFLENSAWILIKY